MSNNKLNQREKTANSIVKKLTKNPLAFLLKQDAILNEFGGEPILSYTKKGNFIAIKCVDESRFIVAVSDKNGKTGGDDIEIAIGFSEQLSTLMHLMYEDTFLNVDVDAAA
tara:strand:- start:1433 stop:1765 length:333 start_codon:yes stop_codon:yes gene_type:complete